MRVYSYPPCALNRPLRVFNIYIDIYYSFYMYYPKEVVDMLIPLLNSYLSNTYYDTSSNYRKWNNSTNNETIILTNSNDPM